VTVYDYRQFKVLFVDDEEQARKYFKMALGERFDVLTAESAERAREVLAKEGKRIGIVVSDQRMPGEGGAKLLGAVRQQFPSTIRILTTAYSDISAAIDAVNSGSIYKYIVKPWEVNDLRVTLQRAMEFRLLSEERDLLVQEKLTTLQQLLVADRVRSLAVLAKGLSHHIRNALDGLESYVTLAKKQIARAPTAPDGDNGMWRDIWSDAERVNRQLMELVACVSDSTLEPSYRFDDLTDLWRLIQTGYKRTGLNGDSIVGLVGTARGRGHQIRCDRALLERMFGILFRHLVRNSDGEGEPEVEYIGETEIWDTQAEHLRLRSKGVWDHQVLSSLFTPFAIQPDAPVESRPDLLAAFFIVHHHGGSLEVCCDPPRGPGFELKLPIDPSEVKRPSVESGLLERLFLHSEEWDRVVREG
jgi:two-component system probable response regulator PhcQ